MAMIKPSITIDDLDREFDEGRIFELGRSLEVRIPRYEEAYKMNNSTKLIIDHLKSRPPGCFCPICEDDKTMIASDIYLAIKDEIK